MNTMSTHRFISVSLFCILEISMISCNGKGGARENAGEAEIIPEDIVEMRDDQIKLASIDTGRVEYRIINTTLKVSGLVAVAPQNLATVCTPMGGFIESVTLIPGQAVKKGQSFAVIENQELVDI